MSTVNTPITILRLRQAGGVKGCSSIGLLSPATENVSRQHIYDGLGHRHTHGSSKESGWTTGEEFQGDDGMAGKHKSQFIFPGNCYPVAFKNNREGYLGGATAHRTGITGATVIGVRPHYLQLQHKQVSDVSLEIPTRFQRPSAGLAAGVFRQHGWNVRWNSTMVHQHPRIHSLNPTKYYQGSSGVQMESWGSFRGPWVTSIDNPSGTNPQLPLASDTSLGNQGNPYRLYASNPIDQFLPSSDKPDDENVTPYDGTIEELDHFCKQRKQKDAVKVLGMLRRQGIFVELAHYFLLFQLCGEEKCLEEARTVHDYVVQSFLNLEIKVYNKMLDMYCKCGSVEDVRGLFETMPQRNLTSWDTMIMGLAANGLEEDAIDLFNMLKQKSLRLDGGIFLTIFHVCGILGAVDEGFLHFESMTNDFGIKPTMEHYSGMVAMLGAVGHLDEAMEFIDIMPCEPTVDVWETLMNLCRVHGNAELGEHCAQIVESLDSSKLIGDSRRGLLPVKASAQGKDRKKAELGIRGRVHVFLAGDRYHPESDKIYY